MSSHYLFSDGVGEIVPFNAKYAYPTQASRTWKSVIKIQPKNGNTFNGQGGTLIRFELPAQGYMNVRNTTLTFDAKIHSSTATSNTIFQNQIQSVFRRLRILYGSLVLEDIRDYNVLCRMLTEGATNQSNLTVDQSSILEGIGGLTLFANNAVFATPAASGFANARLFAIQASQPSAGVLAGASQGLISDAGSGNATRRYVVQLASGLFQQAKLLPLKWMASQVVIELELADYVDCVTSFSGYTPTADFYTLSNLFMNLELLEFDQSYDAAFLAGLQGDGVPIKFCTWDTFINTPVSGGTTQTILIPERNRSLKAIFHVQRPPSRVNTFAAQTGGGSITAYTLPWDSHALLESSNGISTNITGNTQGTTTGNLQNYQFRIGGKYYPAQPVLCGTGGLSNGGAEAYFEFAKALNIVGDYRLSVPENSMRFCSPGLNQLGYSSARDWVYDTGDANVTFDIHGPSATVISADLETSDGVEISGLNGEEQNDIALIIQYSNGQDSSCTYDTFVYFDALLILRANNVVELVK